MNERIKELLEKATVVTYHGPMLGDVANVDQEKFAELIVKECAEFADDHNSEVEGITLGVGRALKNRFGVEE